MKKEAGVKKKEDVALKSLFGGAEVTMICGVLGYVFIFFLKLLLNHYLGTAQYGIIQFLMTILGFGSLIASLGIGSLLVVFIPKYIAQKQDGLLLGIKRYSWIVSVVSSLIVALVLFLSSNLIVDYFDFTSTVGILLMIMSWFLPLRVISELLSSRLTAQADPLFPAFNQQILDRVILFFGLGICVALGKSIMWYVFFIGVSYLCQILFLASSLLLHHHPLSEKNHPSESRKVQFATKEWFLFSLPLVFSSLLGYIFEWTDYFTVAKFFNAQTLGMYDLTYSLAAYLLFIPAVFGTLFIPILTQLYLKDKKTFAHVWSKLQIFAFACIVACSMIFFTFAKELLVTLYGPSFDVMAPMLRFLVVCFLVGNMFAFTQSILMMQGHTRFIFATMFLFGVLDLSMNIVAAKFFCSVTLIALSTGVFLVLLKICEWIKVNHGIKLRLPVISFVRLLLIGFVVGVVARLLLYLLSMFGAYTLLYVIISSLIALLLFLIIAVHQKLIPYSELKMLKSSLIAVTDGLHIHGMPHIPHWHKPHWHHNNPRRKF